MTKSPEFFSTFSCTVHGMHPPASPDAFSEGHLSSPPLPNPAITTSPEGSALFQCKNPAELAKITFVVVFTRYFTYFSLRLLDIGI